MKLFALSSLPACLAAFGFLSLFIHFTIRNLRYGSSLTNLISTENSIDGAPDNTWLFRLLVIHLKNWYIIVFQIVIAFLLIGTPAGRDVINYLVETTDDGPLSITFQISTICFSVFFYSIAIWIIPWHLLDHDTQRSLRGNLLELKVLRLLAFMTFPIIMAAIIAAANNDPDFDSQIYLLTLALLYLGYWGMQRYFHNRNGTLVNTRTNLAQITKRDAWLHNIFWAFILIAGGLAVAISTNLQFTTEIGLFLITVILGLLFWYTTGPSISDCDPVSPSANWFTKFKCRIIRFIKNLLVGIDNITNPLLQKMFPDDGPGVVAGEENDPENKKETLKEAPSDRLQRNRAMYRALIFTSFLMAYACAFLPNLQPIPPFVIVFSGLGFVLMTIDFMFYTGRRIINTNKELMVELKEEHKEKGIKKQARAKQPQMLRYRAFVNKKDLPLFVTWCFLWLCLILSNSTSKAMVEPVEAQNAPRRVSMEAYLDKWANDRIREMPDSGTYKVFLFAAQGGGSRAGFWTSSALTRMQENFDVQRHTLAISSVSGSAPGVLTALAWWNAGEGNRPAGRDYCKNMYGRNFVTSGLAGNFYGDLLRKFWPFLPDHWMKNRNRRLCEEETWGMEQSLQGSSSSGYLFTQLHHEKQLGWQPFSSIYTKDGVLQTGMPLSFPNTTHVQTGRRGVLSPVINLAGNPDFFVNIIDLNQRIEVQEGKKMEITAVESANLAELFPYISAAANVHDNLGTYVDGGYYENYGISTILEIYNVCQYWKKEISATDTTLNKYKHRFEFYVVSLLNDPYEREGVDVNTIQLQSSTPNQIVAPALAIYKTPFRGHAETMRMELVKQIDPKRYFEIRLHKSGLPLTRVLTSSNLNTMDEAMTEELDRFYKWLK